MTRQHIHNAEDDKHFYQTHSRTPLVNGTNPFNWTEYDRNRRHMGFRGHIHLLERSRVTDQNGFSEGNTYRKIASCGGRIRENAPNPPARHTLCHLDEKMGGGLKTCKRAVKHGSKVVLTGTEEGNHGHEKILDGNS